jgi:RimJ/RimL family protein N-acetyltransferase
VICETSRLILRAAKADDAAFVTGMNNDPEVCRFLGGMKTPEESLLKIVEAIDHQRQHGFSRWSVTLKDTGAIIGRCGLMRKHISGVTEIELGYAFAREHWGRGYATEAARAALDYSFGVLRHRRVVAIIYPKNHASIGVAGKIGMAFERDIVWEGLPAGLYAAGPANIL